MLTSVLAATIASVMVLTVPMAATDPPKWDGNSPIDPPPAPPPGPDSSSGSISVTVTVNGSTSTGRTFASTSTSTVAPMCWLGRGPTGMEYYEYWKPGGPAREADTLDDYAAQGLLHDGFEAYATDNEGRWYESTCRVDAPAEVSSAYFLSHDAVWVPAGAPAPAPEAQVDPAVLAQIASDSMDLPRGTIRWNPSLGGTGATIVNAETWVWVEDGATTASVTAEVPGTWARVDATLSSLTLDAPGADSVTCPDTGTPWTAGATSTTCSTTFFRSTARLPVKSGQSMPTATLTATATCSASWVSSQDPDTPTEAADAADHGDHRDPCRRGPEHRRPRLGPGTPG